MRTQFTLMRWPIICTVHDGASALQPPATMVTPEGIDDIDSWFDEIVRWWQSPDEPKNRAFTHGNRLRRFGGVPTDQVAHVVRALRADARSTRAIAILVDPTSDFDEHNSN
jgi:hypothetical protein